MSSISEALDTTSWQPQPVHRHLIEELDLACPFWQYADMFRGGRYSFLLDSAADSTTQSDRNQNAKRHGRFSFLGGDPSLIFRAKRRRDSMPKTDAQIEIEIRKDPDGQLLSEPSIVQRSGDPFEQLRELLAAYHVDYDAYADHPVPLLSGAIGYIGYEAGYFIEELPDLGADDLNLPDIYLMFVDAVLGHYHDSGRSYLSVVGRGDSDVAAQRRAVAIRDALLRRVAAFRGAPSRVYRGSDVDRGDRGSVDVRQHFSQRTYCRAVEAAKEHIYAGDVFEVCMTHRFESPLVGGNPWGLYRQLRHVNPAPFACYLNLPEAKVVSSSPERFLSLSPDRVAESRPIKGTRPRGDTPTDDRRLREELLNSEKDRAENAMIVDLVRNDLGRVCKFHSIEVHDLMVIEDYATVFQMVSTIRGVLDDRFDGLDLIRAAFPGGSMTGAPKIEAMKIIDRLEPVKRGIYSGSIGYLDFAGHLDLNIVIRSFVVKDAICYYNVGGAIVADSDPEAEYRETLDKARALIDALGNLVRGSRSTGAILLPGKRFS